MRCCSGLSLWWDNSLERLNARVNDSPIGRYFELEGRKTTFTLELRAGTVTFLTMAYVLAVNANIIADTGGPCNSSDCTGPDKSFDCRFFDQGYLECVNEVRQDLVTATAASSLIACFIMGAGANMPLALAPGMGLNAYFASSVVGYRGTGNVPYESALAGIFVEGWLFVLLAVTGVRGAIIKLVPRSIMLATSSGIGLFLAFIGLQAQQGLGVSVYSSTTVVTLGGCPAPDQVKTYVVRDPADVCTIASNGTAVPSLGFGSPSYACLRGRMESATMWLGIAGFCITAIMMQRRIKGSVMIGIVFVTVIAWIPGHAASYFGAGSSIRGGEARLQTFKSIVRAPSIQKTGLALDFKGLGNGHLWLAMLTFLYVDFLDTTGTLFSMANFLNNFIPGFVNEQKQFPRQQTAFVVDGLATVCGSLMGTSPVATYIESAAGIREGGRTGVTALTAAFYFFVSLFFVPVLSNIPPYAVGGALLIVGALMVANVAKIPWERIGQAIPAFLTLAVMPLTYSIAYGVVAGLVAYIIINGTNWAIDTLFAGVKTLPQWLAHVRQARHHNNENGGSPKVEWTWRGRPGANPSSASSQNGSRHGSHDGDGSHHGIRKPPAGSMRAGRGSLTPSESFANMRSDSVGHARDSNGVQRESGSSGGATPPGAATPDGSQHGPTANGGYAAAAASTPVAPAASLPRPASEAASLSQFLHDSPRTPSKRGQAPDGLPSASSTPRGQSPRGRSPSRAGSSSALSQLPLGHDGRPRRATESALPPARKPRRRMQTFDDAWGGGEETAGGAGGRAGSGGSSGTTSPMSDGVYGPTAGAAAESPGRHAMVRRHDTPKSFEEQYSGHAASDAPSDAGSSVPSTPKVTPALDASPIDPGAASAQALPLQQAGITRRSVGSSGRSSGVSGQSAAEALPGMQAIFTAAAANVGGGVASPSIGASPRGGSHLSNSRPAGGGSSPLPMSPRSQQPSYDGVSRSAGSANEAANELTMRDMQALAAGASRRGDGGDLAAAGADGDTEGAGDVKGAELPPASSLRPPSLTLRPGR